MVFVLARLFAFSSSSASCWLVSCSLSSKDFFSLVSYNKEKNFVTRHPCTNLQDCVILSTYSTIFQENPSDWDLHVDNLLRKASSRLYILRVCKYFGYPKEQLTKLFDLLIMSLFLYGIEIWGAAYHKFFKRAFRFGYTNNLYAIAEVIRNRDCKLWNTITDTPSHPLYQLLPPKKQRFLRNRGHYFTLPAVKTEHFKMSFINRCFFNFI